MFEDMDSGSVTLVIILGIVIFFAIFYSIIKSAVKSATKEQVDLLKEQNEILRNKVSE